MANGRPRMSPRPSTRAFTKEARRVPGYGFFDWIHGYVYVRWPYLYIGIAKQEHPLSKIIVPVVNAGSRAWRAIRGGSASDSRAGFADSYHGKVMPLEAATRLVSVQEDVDLRDLEKVIPYSKARDIVLRNPDHIVALECPCRATSESPCLPLDVCLIVGEPFASLVVEHHPRRSRWISQQEAADILRAEQERGHVHHAFLKDAMLGRFYAICNCCSCCCGAMLAWQTGTPMLTSSGYVCRATDDGCAGCGTCAKFCQFRAIELRNDRVWVNETACMGCGVCVAKCDQGVLSLYRDPSRGEPLEIGELLESVPASAPI
jgi:Pyruvate/2-oxoacid:ferredoxin oxidoreductase delta subunit